MIRYRTGDRCSLISDPCACGRTFRRISRIRGRYDGVVIIKGVNVIPERIGDLLESIEGERPPFQLVATRHGHQDELEICIEITEKL